MSTLPCCGAASNSGTPPHKADCHKAHCEAVLGWICPICGASLAPTVPRCGCTAPLGAEYVEDVSIFDTLTICDSCGGLSIHHAPPTCKNPDNHFKAPQGEAAPFGKRDSLL